MGKAGVYTRKRMLLRGGRRKLCESGRVKYPDRILVIVEKSPKSDIPDIDKNKYLVPGDLSVGQFFFVVRKRIMLRSENAMVIFVKNVVLNTATLMSKIYEEHKDKDRFLCMQYSGESTFGSHRESKEGM